MTRAIGEIAKFVTSKNAGPFLLTLDIIFPDEATYRRFTRLRPLDRSTIARLYGIQEDDVLKITSSDLRDEEVYTVTYDVADLVIPIPNFSPTVNMGLSATIQEAYRQAQFAGGAGGQAPVVVAANHTGGANAKLGDNVLANLAQVGPQGLTSGRPGTGPGGLEGGNQPNFDTLIELIVSTIAPQTWEEVGGPGRITRFEFVAVGDTYGYPNTDDAAWKPSWRPGRQPLGVAFEMVSGTKPAERIPARVLPEGP